MRRTGWKMTALALGFSGWASLAGCSGSRSAGAPTEAAQATGGSLSLALQLAGGGTVNSASYSITGPGGFSRTGTINVSASQTLTAVIAGLPVGLGYQISLR